MARPRKPLLTRERIVTTALALVDREGLEAVSTRRLAAELGPPHRRSFQIQIVVGEEVLAEAEGKTRKEAAQTAAKAALEKLNRSQ